jgi:hypothetical protein
MSLVPRLICIRALVAFVAIGFSAVSSAAGSATGATVTGLNINQNDSMVFISISIAKTGNPSCSVNTAWSFVLPLTTALQNQMYALLLSA